MKKKEQKALLSAIIHTAQSAYYSGAPVMSDSEYDDYVAKLEELTPNAPIGPASPRYEVRHLITMRSIKKRKEPVSTMGLYAPKWDGCAVELVFHAGFLMHAATRGDGTSGLDITAVAQRIPLCNRRELVTPVTQALYVEAIYYGLKPNKRNIVAGLLNSQHPDEEDLRFCEFRAWLKLEKGDLSLCSPELSRDPIQPATFWTDGVCGTRPTDGVVIYTDYPNNFGGADQHYYDWCYCIKPEAPSAWTTITSIEWSVSRLGRVKPVAVFEPIVLGDATITRATLNNAQNAQHYRAGVRVLVSRRNEIIPHIETKAPLEAEDPLPTYCPSCSSRLNLWPPDLLCPNELCPDRRQAMLDHAFAVYGLDKPRNFALTDGPNWMIAAQPLLYYKKRVPLWKWLVARSFSGIGPVQARKYTLETLKNDSSVGGHPQLFYYSSDEGEEELAFIEDFLEPDVTSGPLKDLHFCITGSFDDCTREELIELINTNGGVYHSSVVKGLSVLLVGDNPGSKKEKAEARGIPMWSLEYFLARFNLTLRSHPNDIDLSF